MGLRRSIPNGSCRGVNPGAARDDETVRFVNVFFSENKWMCLDQKPLFSQQASW